MTDSLITVSAAKFARELKEKHPPFQSAADEVVIAAYVEGHPQYSVDYDGPVPVTVSFKAVAEQSASSAAQLATHSSHAQDEPFVRMGIPIRIWGMDDFGRPFSQQARTLSVSRHGALIGGLEHIVRANEVIGLSREGQKSRVLIVWVGPIGTAQSGQIAVRAIDADQNLWDIDFSNVDPKTKPKFSERRFTPRYRCQGSIAIWQEGTQYPIYSSLTDISLGGCYIEIMTPLPSGSKITVLINLPGILIRSAATVSTSHPAVGMGLRFDSMDDSSRQGLRRALAQLATEEPAK